MFDTVKVLFELSNVRSRPVNTSTNHLKRNWLACIEDTYLIYSVVARYAFVLFLGFLEYYIQMQTFYVNSSPVTQEMANSIQSVLYVAYSLELCDRVKIGYSLSGVVSRTTFRYSLWQNYRIHVYPTSEPKYWEGVVLSELLPYWSHGEVLTMFGWIACSLVEDILKTTKREIEVQKPVGGKRYILVSKITHSNI